MNLNQWQDMNLTRSAEVFKMCDDWSLNDWSSALSGEIGEAQNILKKVRRRGPAMHLTQGEKAALRLEIGDAATYLAIWAGKMGLTLEECCQAAWDKVNARMDYEP